MATIQNSIKLTDGMTPALQSMNKALNIVLNSFEQMQKVSGKAIDTASIQTARQELAKAQVQFNNIEKEIAENKAKQDQFNQSVRNGSGAVATLWGKLKSIVGIYAGFQTAKGLVNLSDTMAQTTARLNLMTGGLEKTKQLQNEIYEASMRSRGSYLDMADSVAKLGLNTGDLFKNTGETVKFMETLNKMFVVAGTESQQASAAMLQLTQALGSGVLQGDEYKSIGENATIFKNIIADYMGVTTGELKKMAAEGVITAEVVKNAMFNAASDIEEKFRKMNYTWGQVWTMMKNFAIKQAEPMLTKINEIVNSERFYGFANAVGSAIQTVIAVVGGLFDVIVNVVGFVYDNWTVIESILSAIAIVYLPTIIGLLKAKAVALWAIVKPILVQAAAWLAVNWYILLIVAALTGVIWLCKWTGVTFSDVCGVIAGSVMWVGAVIWNVLKFIWNVIVTVVGIIVITVINAFTLIGNIAWGCGEWVVNAFSWCAENLGTVFYNIGVWWDNLWIDARVGFYSFINDVLSKLSSLAAKIQPLAELLDVDLSGMIGNAQASINTKISNLESGRREAKSYTAMGKTNWSKFDYTPYQSNIDKFRADYTSLSGAYNKGFDWGSNVGDGISEKLSKFSLTDNLQAAIGNPANLGDLMGGNGIGSGGSNPALDKISKGVGNIADNTSSLASSKEDLTYMRDLAEQEAINRYTLTDLKVEMTNNNNINSNMDLDKVVDYLQEKVYEGVLSTAEGVHF